MCAVLGSLFFAMCCKACMLLPTDSSCSRPDIVRGGVLLPVRHNALLLHWTPRHMFSTVNCPSSHLFSMCAFWRQHTFGPSSLCDVFSYSVLNCFYLISLHKFFSPLVMLCGLNGDRSWHQHSHTHTAHHVPFMCPSRYTHMLSSPPGVFCGVRPNNTVIPTQPQVNAHTPLLPQPCPLRPASARPC